MALRLGFARGQVVQEFYLDEDADEDLRDSVVELAGGDMVDEDSDEVADVVLLWWREEDGDVGDGLMDALRDLSSSGRIWLLTPKIGRTGYVDPADIAEGVLTAGLALANTVPVSSDWHAQKVARPKGGRR